MRNIRVFAYAAFAIAVAALLLPAVAVAADIAARPAAGSSARHKVIFQVSDALAQGVKILACENTMTNTKTTRADILPNIGYVKAGVTTLMARQREGWAYIRP